MTNLGIQTSSVHDVEIKRFVGNMIPYADLHNIIVDQIKTDVEVKMVEQPGLSRYEVVQEVLKTYSQQRLNAIISNEKKAMRKDWLQKVFHEMRAYLLHPGLFIFAIAAAICYFATGYFGNYTDIHIPGLILIVFLLLFVAYQYFSTYMKNNSGEKKLLQKDTFRFSYNSIFLMVLITPEFAMDIVDLFWSGAVIQFLQSNLWYSIWFVYICTMLYIMWSIYNHFYNKQLDGANTQPIPKIN